MYSEPHTAFIFTDLKAQFSNRVSYKIRIDLLSLLNVIYWSEITCSRRMSQNRNGFISSVNKVDFELE